MKIVSEYEYERLNQIDNNQGANSDGVWLATDTQLNAKVAVKEMAKTRFSNVNQYFQEAQKMFEASHPNVLPIQVATQTQDRVCLSMPFCKNGSLMQKIEHGPTPLSVTLKVGRQILSGLAAIHSAGIFHLDIKPSNVLFDDNSNAMIADFGQARAIDNRGLVSPLPPMYPMVIPPEFFTSGVGTETTDIFLVGVTLYRAINGDPHFRIQRNTITSIQELKDAVLRKKLPDSKNFLPHVPARLRTIIRKAIQLDRTKRFQSASQFLDALGQVKIKNDCEVTYATNDEITWKWIRAGKSDLVYELRENGGGWDVSIFTESSNGTKRKKDKSEWLINASRPTAIKHLNALFRSLV